MEEIRKEGWEMRSETRESKGRRRNRKLRENEGQKRKERA